MRKVLDILEFEKLCNEFGPVTYIYDERWQPEGTPVSYMDVISAYTGVYVTLVPNSIIFKNSHGSLCFNYVKQIMYDDIPADDSAYLDNVKCGDLCDGDEYETAEVFTIVCGSGGTTLNDIPYEICVERNPKNGRKE